MNLTDTLKQVKKIGLGKLTAGAVGLTATIGPVAQRLGPYGQAHNLKETLMRETLGNTNTKYACAELEEFSRKKEYMEVKLAFEKVSAVTSPGDQVQSMALSEGFGWLRRLLGGTAQSINSKVTDDPKRATITKALIKRDPVISVYERENPGGTITAMNTMKAIAPNLSTNAAVAQSFIRNTAMSGGPLDFQTIKGLADAETAVARAKHENAWGYNAAK